MHGNFLGENERERGDANIEATTSSICAFGKNRLAIDLQKHHFLLPYFPNFKCYFSMSLLLSNSTNKQILDNHSVTLWELHLSMKSIIVLFISDCPSKAGCDSGHRITPLAEHVYWTWHWLLFLQIPSPAHPALPPFPRHPMGSPGEGGRLHSQLWNAALCKCRSAGTGRGLCFVPRVKAKAFQDRRLGEGSGKQLPAASHSKRSLNVRKQKSEGKNAQLINVTQVGNTGQAQWQGKALQKWGQMRKQDMEF